ncbi:MAG: VC0807 family protein [Nanoarchaeota archaeon]
MAKRQDRENPLLNIMLNVVIPVLIMTQLNERLGALPALALALLFPVSYGAYDLLSQKRWNVFSLIGFISILLTGGIGLLALDKGWLVIKETAVPLVLGIIVLISQKMKKPLMMILLDQIFDMKKVKKLYAEQGKAGHYRNHMKYSSYFFALTFFVSAILNFLVASIILVSEPGTPAYTEEIGRMTALSYPIIVVPTMVMMVGLMFYLIRTIEKHTKKQIIEFLRI